MSGMAVLSLLFSAATAIADGSMNSALTGGLRGGQESATASVAPVTVYTAKKILTMERSNPEATAVAVAGKRILAVGSFEEVKAALGDRQFTVNDTFKSKVIAAGSHRPAPPSDPRSAHPSHGSDRDGGLGPAGPHVQGGKQLQQSISTA